MGAEHLGISSGFLELNTKEKEVVEYWTFILQDAGAQGFLKGGFIRDKIANRVRGILLVPEDFDILVIGKIHSILRLAKRHGAEVIERRWHKGTPVFRYKIPGFDTTCEMGVAMGVTSYETLNLGHVRLEDAKATDLDVNSMSLQLVPGNLEIFDPFNAVGSIIKGEVSLLDWRSLYRNPENIFRAYRIANRLKCELSERTKEYFNAHAHVVAHIKRPFLDSQLRPILESSNGRDIWKQMEQTGITQHILSSEAISFDQAKASLLL